MFLHRYWDFFLYLEKEPPARSFLTEAYRAQGREQPEKLAFQQSNRFLYTWKQARTYYDAATESELLIRPLLSFYGCVHLLKGLLIAKDPTYPATSKMLQHGVSTRKVKRNPYRLLDDDVRPQKEGLFTTATKILGLPAVAQRYQVGQLFGYLAEMREGVQLLTKKTEWCNITSQVVSEGSSLLTFPDLADGPLAYSTETFVSYMQRLAPSGMMFQQAEMPIVDRQKQIVVDTPSRLVLTQHPLLATGRVGMGEDDSLLFWNGSPEDVPLPTWATHYLLLYLLSMLCRYETEWWGELVLTPAYGETYLVEKFLAVHLERFPQVVEGLLTSDWRNM